MPNTTGINGTLGWLVQKPVELMNSGCMFDGHFWPAQGKAVAAASVAADAIAAAASG